MVSDGKIHICGRCGEELLGRAEVEAMVDGRKRVYIPRDLMQWNTYSSGSAYVYAEIRGVTGSRGETKNIMCGCTAEKVSTPSMRMIRPEFRDHIRAVFGDALSMPLLFKLPLTMVAWENSGLVGTTSTDDGLMVTDDGVAIIDIVADMSRIGLFDGAVERFDVSDVMTGFSYLHMILPRYRSFVATDYGASTTLANMLACVPLDWFDWQKMMTLRCDQGDAGSIRIVPGAGLSVASEVVRLAVAAGQLTRRGIGRALKPVSKGGRVVTANTCIQFMPADDLLEEDNVRNSFHATYLADLAVGDAFLPVGPVVLRGHHLAVTFEPGVVIRTVRGTRVSARGGSVTVFLNGSVTIELCNSNDGPQDFGVTADGVSARMFQVHVACDSYAEDTELGGWYRDRFDVLSTTARFNAMRAEFVLLSSASIDRGGVTQALRFVGSTAADRSGVVEQVCELPVDKLGTEFLVSGPAVLGSGTIDAYGEWRATVNGVVEFDDNGVFGLLAGARIVFRRPAGWRFSDWGQDPPMTVSLMRTLPVDDYAIDGGGPSDSDGEYRDETLTHVKDAGLSVLSSLRVFHCDKVLAGNAPLYDKVWNSAAFGLGYTRLARHPAALARRLGVAPSVRDILWLSVVDVDLDKLGRGGWANEAGRWRYVDHDYHVSWETLARGAVSSCELWKGNSTVVGHLCDKHGLTSVWQMLLTDRCE